MEQLLSHISEVSRRSERIADGLDQIGIGYFEVDAAGQFITGNRTAAQVFALPPERAWTDLALTQADAILRTGLAQQFDAVRSDHRQFVIRDQDCSNRDGRLLCLTMICWAERTDHPGGNMLVGLTRNRTEQEILIGANPYEELQILAKVAAALSSSTDLTSVLKVILTGATASQGLGFNRAFLFLYDRDKHLLRGHLAVGPESAEEAGIIWGRLENQPRSLEDLLDEVEPELPAAGGLSQRVANIQIDLNQHSVIASACSDGTWINLDSTPERDEPTSQVLRALGTGSLALVPLRHRSELLGLLAADNAITGASINDQSVQLLQTLADQAAVAMKQAGLFKELIKRADDLEQTNRRLAESQDQLVRVEKVSIIGELTAAIAHEIRNPLTIIGGFANLMRNQQVPDDQRQYLDIIVSETKRCESVLNDVLDFSRVAHCDSCSMDLSDVVRDAISLISNRVRRDAAEIVFVPSAERLPVFGNQDQILHAVHQFVRLAVEDLLPPGRAQIRTERQEDMATVVIRLEAPENHRQGVLKSLRQVFTENKASQRLTVLVACETVKVHNGTSGFLVASDGTPALYLHLPLTPIAREAYAEDSGH